MKKSILYALVIVASVIILVSAYSPWWLNSPQKNNNPPLSANIHGSLTGTIVDKLTNRSIEGAKVGIWNFPSLNATESEDQVTGTTDVSGTWLISDVNFSQPLSVTVSKSGYYPAEIYNVSTNFKENFLGNYLYDCQEISLARISKNFTFGVSNGGYIVLGYPPYVTETIPEGETFNVSRGDTLSFDMVLINIDQTAFLGSPYAYGGGFSNNTFGLWVYPKSDTVEFWSPYLGTPGSENVTFGSLDGSRFLNNFYQFSQYLRFNEVGNYTVFVSYKDTFWGAAATTYASTTFYVNVRNIS